MENFKIINGNSLIELEKIEKNSIDSIVTDPPYELGFMGKSWDNSGIAYNVELWKKCFDVLKPGGYLLAFGGSRTFHRIACAIEDGGFEIRDTIMWIYGSGFPKSLNIGLAIDKKNGVESEIIGIGKSGNAETHTRTMKSIAKNGNEVFGGEFEIKKAQNEWNGWGSCLKPAYEPIIVARKPFKGSLVDNVIKYGVGGLNIDECRIDYNGEIPNIGGRANFDRGDGYGFKALKEKCEANENGRFPANVILTYDDTDFNEVCGGFPETKSEGGSAFNKKSDKNSMFNLKQLKDDTCFHDSGSAARYFYCAKASKKDRDDGLDLFEEKQKVFNGKSDNSSEEMKDVEQRFTTRLKNIHPTVKPTELMQYIIRLVTPKGGTILDPFNGSGSTGKAAMFENRERNANYKYIGIELDQEYCKISQARIDYVINEYEYEKENNSKKGIIQLSLFGD